MTMPIIDKARSGSEWLCFSKPGDDHIHWAHRSAVLRAQHNTHIGEDPTAPFYGMTVDESDCIEMLRVMGDRL